MGWQQLVGSAERSAELPWAQQQYVSTEEKGHGRRSWEARPSEHLDRPVQLWRRHDRRLSELHPGGLHCHWGPEVSGVATCRLFGNGQRSITVKRQSKLYRVLFRNWPNFA